MSRYARSVLLADAPLTFGEFMRDEDLPLAVVFRAVMEFLQGRRDVVLFGAHAVNAWCEPARMTQDVDLMALDGARVAEELRARLAEQFHIAACVREVVAGAGFRVYQLRKQGNRHLADIRQVEVLPVWKEIAGVQVAAPIDLIAMKTVSLVQRHGQPKGTTDLADLQRLLLASPDLKIAEGDVRARLVAIGASDALLARWSEIAVMEIVPDEDQGY